MNEILHSAIPEDLEKSIRLPGVQPLDEGRWLRVDAAYGAQMAYRRKLLAQRRDQVFWQAPEAADAVSEAFDEACKLMPAMGFGLTEQHVRCPDGTVLDRRSDSPLVVLGKSVQEDICIMQKQGDEHVLTAAVVCFPASWTLSEKAGQPLTRIHKPVADYDNGLARRVQRMFDGVQVGRPLWRNNYLRYENPDLHQPRTEAAPPRSGEFAVTAPYERAERQCFFRLPQTAAVVFSIHTYVAQVRTD